MARIEQFNEIDFLIFIRLLGFATLTLLGRRFFPLGL
jgi:hypothetical protein